MPRAPGAPCWVLTGAEAHSCQGVSYEKRELSHTSLIFIGHAYGQLRHAGVPRSQIIVIAQLQDYLTFLTLGADGKLGAGMPSAAFQFQKRQVEQSCALLMAEGGAHYDGEDVNPSTFMDVLLGQQPHTGVTGPPAPARPRHKCHCVDGTIAEPSSAKMSLQSLPEKRVNGAGVCATFAGKSFHAA